MLSVASGFTTYYGLSHFILPWIALIITIAIQSIIVICSLEVAGIHWKANRLRYLSVWCLCWSLSQHQLLFSYFKFYEVSQSETIRISRINEVRKDVDTYLAAILITKGDILKQQNSELEKATTDVTQALFRNACNKFRSE